MWRHTVGSLLVCGLICLQGATLQGALPLSPAAAVSPATVVWTAEDWARARQFSPLPLPPPDPSNALSDNEQAARLGHRLFFEPRLSPHGISCATCHRPEQGFTDEQAVANTLKPLQRNTMTILNVGHYRWLTWDGARDSLWHQAAAPLEHAHEMASSRLYVIRIVMRYYGDALRQLGVLPPDWDSLWPSLPAAGQLGEAAFDNLPAAQQEAVNRVYVTILKCLAAYERQVVSAPAPFDRFIAGETAALSLAAQRGFQHFLRLECDTCHSTPLFSDDQFHNLGLPSGPVPDQGRAAGLARLKSSIWRGSGPYADGPPVVRAEAYPPGEALLGSFRTPSLRELATTGPYGHNGVFASLEAWLDHYVEVTTTPATERIGTLDPALLPLELTRQEKQELVAFMLSLSSPYASEWTQAPGLPEEAP
ncbi:MAG: cytochrome-c peroxidase [Candidatus Tectimicrobiota bacterium]